MKTSWFLGLAVALTAIGCGTAAPPPSATAAQSGPAAAGTDLANGAADTAPAPDSAGGATAASDTVADATAAAFGDGAAASAVPDAVAVQEVAPVDVAPAEPCGIVPGKTLCDVQLQGYIHSNIKGLASSSPFETGFYLQNVLALHSQKYAVVMLGAWW